MEKTMKTIEELDVELELLKSDIEKQYEVLSTLKQRKSFLLTSIASATVRERRDAERRARNAVSAARRKAQRLAKKYDIEWDDDSYREFGVYNHFHYFPQPVWLKVMTRSRMVTTQTIGMRRCGSLSSMRSITPSTPIMRTASISRSRHTVKPKPPSGGLR
jgi:hypothetical protein